MPRLIQHNVAAGNNIPKDVYNDEEYHGTVEVLEVTDVSSTPAEDSMMPVSLDWAYLHSNDSHAHGIEAVFTVTEKEKLAGISTLSADCFCMTLAAYASSPSDSTTYYFGAVYSRVPVTSGGICRVYPPRVGTSRIRAARVVFNVTSTLGSAETFPVYIRKNDTTDYPISNAMTADATVCECKNDDMNVLVTNDDFIEIKFVTPAWATNPSTIYYTAFIWFDAVVAETVDLSVTTNAASSVGDTGATLNGYLAGLGGAASVDVSFEYGKTLSYGSTTTPAETKTGMGGVSKAITGLDESTLYYYRAKAVGDTTVYGSPSSFTTGAGDPDPENYYGTAAYAGADPIGGGAGYTHGITQAEVVAMGAHGHVITSSADFIAHMVGGGQLADSGDVVFVPSNIEVDLTSLTASLYIPTGVTVASDRGYQGSLGGMIKHTSLTMGYIACLRCNGNGVRLTGLRLRGADASYGVSGQKPQMTGFSCNGKQYIEVDNCEVYQWNYAGITNYTDLVATTAGVVDWDKAAHIHHNYIHHCRRPSMGYGITAAKASALIECNIFNACRHMFSGDRSGDVATPAGDETYIEFRYNILGYDTYESNGTMFDHHGGSDTVEEYYGTIPSMTGVYNCWAGGEIWIHHNDFKINERAVSIRGFSRFSWTIEWNWIMYQGSASDPYSAIRQRIYTIPITPGDTSGPHYVNSDDSHVYLANNGEAITVENNWWGTETPPQP